MVVSNIRSYLKCFFISKKAKMKHLFAGKNRQKDLELRGTRLEYLRHYLPYKAFYVNEDPNRNVYITSLVINIHNNCSRSNIGGST